MAGLHKEIWQQVDTAVEGGATAFVTNDKALVRLTLLIDILLLQDFL